MQALTVVFIGRSGCGKGTQAALLQKKLEEISSAHTVFYIYTGDHLRDLIHHHRELYTAQLLDDKVMTPGEKAPDFLAVWAWGNEMIHGMSVSKHLIMDGAPRSVLEARMLDDAFLFYERKATCIISLDVSAEWARTRMLERRREDDSEEKINRRLAYYEKYVAPTLSYYEEESSSHLIRINGEQKIQQVHEDIARALNL